MPISRRNLLFLPLVSAVPAPAKVVGAAKVAGPATVISFSLERFTNSFDDWPAIEAGTAAQTWEDEKSYIEDKRGALKGFQDGY